MEEVKFGKKDLKRVEVVVTGKYLNSVPDAEKVRYDDGDTLLGADNVQEAIEKIIDNVQDVTASCDNIRDDLDGARMKIAELDEADVSLDLRITSVTNEVRRRYIKPETGIPLDDLNSGVRTSLSWANTAVQPADLESYPTTDNVLGWIRDKQDKLVSGENIKTINGRSVLGAGDIEIKGGNAKDVSYSGSVSASNVQEAIDRLDASKLNVLSRNLIVNSNFDKDGESMYGWRLSGQSSQQYGYIAANGFDGKWNAYYSKGVRLECTSMSFADKRGSYVLSFYYKTNMVGSYIILPKSGVINQGEDGKISLPVSEEWNKASFVMTLSGDDTNLSFVGNTYDGLYIACVQLEEGATATEYSRAEDGYATERGLADAMSTKQDVLTDKNLKTINGESLLGEGNINIEGGSIGDGSVVTNMLADDAVTEGKLSEDVRTKLNSGGAIDYVSEFVNGGVVNIQSTGTIEAVYNSLAKGGVALCIIGDSHGDYPSVNTRVNVNEKYLQSASYLFSTEPRGANVGDLLMITKRDYVFVTVCALKIIPINDCKLADGEYNATEGIITAWDKARINKVDGIESHLTDTRNWLSSVNDTVEKNLYRTRYSYGMHFGNMLKTGVCAYTPLYIDGIDANWTVFVDCSADPDSGGYYHLKQTVVCRDGENIGKMWTRLGWYKGEGEDLNFLDWQEIGGGNAFDGLFDWHFNIDVESGKLDVNEGGLKSPLGASYLMKNLGEENEEELGAFLSLSENSMYVGFTTDYTYNVFKNEESGEWMVEKYPTYSERFATKDEVRDMINESIIQVINSDL